MPPEVFATLLLVRRGPVHPGWDRRALGRSDPPLSRGGRVLERRAIERIAGLKPRRVVASDLRRAAGTGERLADLCGASFAALPALRERDLGSYDGRIWSDLLARHPGEVARFLRDFCSARPPGGETLPEMHSRVVKAVWAEARRRPRQAIAMVAHAGPIRAVLARALGIDLPAAQSFQLDPFSLSRVELQGKGAVLAGLNLPL